MRYFCLLISCIFNLSCQSLIDKVGGNFDENSKPLSAEAQALVDSAFEGIDGVVHDIHVHIIGVGNGGTGASVHPSFFKWTNLSKWVQMKIYMSASGLKDLKNVDQRYVRRLVRLARGVGRPYKVHILGFDKHYKFNGQLDEERTEIYVPNEYIYKLSREYSDIFVPVVSIHPYRKDAVEKLELWAKKGVRWVKWLPNVMGIDPSNEKIIPYYKMMKKYNMTLLTHAGEEKAVRVAGMQELGNPLLLRGALDQGVRVVVAHCASLGEGEDLDSKGREKMANVELFLRMMGEKKYEGLLYGGLSATNFINRLDGPLKSLLNRQEFHSRFIYSSDYPLPAVNILIPVKKMIKKGYLNRRDEKSLREIYSQNPLLFNFVIQRKLQHPKSGKGFKKRAFQYPF